jgi:2',3'-cyclic-nucleotide 2'-phosphodiesterase
MRILMLGDIMGRPGRAAVTGHLTRVRRDYGLDCVIANGENASGGIGLAGKHVKGLLSSGIDVLTGGNHSFRHKDVIPAFADTDRLLRPANLPPGAPGAGWRVFRPAGLPPFAVINLLGRMFMEAVDCPFRTAEAILEAIPGDVAIRLVDFHAEATSEKKALAYFLDGRVTAVCGTHTHVQTNDAQLLPRGTATLTDCGLTGPVASAIGMDPDNVIARFTTGLAHRFMVSRSAPELQGALLDIDAATGKAVTIAAWRLAV